MADKIIQRATDLNEDQDFYSDPIYDILNSVNISKMLGADGKLKQEYYNDIDGEFDYDNLPMKFGKVKMIMKNPITEWIVGNILAGDETYINFNNANISANFGKLVDFVKMQICFKSSFDEIYLEKVEFLTTKKIYKRGRKEKGRQAKKVIKITNPKTNRIIKVDKETYKKIYGKIILKKVDFKFLSVFEQIDYKIIDNCASDLFTIYENTPISKLEQILNRKIDKDISLDELIYIYCEMNMNVKVYDAIHNIYYDSNTKNYDRIFKIYGDHIYLLSSDIEKNKCKKRLISKLEDIEKYNNNVLIVSDIDLFDSIKRYIKEKCIMINYNDSSILYKTNKIYFDPYYGIDKKILKDNKSHNRTVYNMINSRLNLTGHMNQETLNIFYSSNKIRFMRTDKINSILIDENKTYPSQLTKRDIYYSIPSINDYWKIYDGSKLVVCGWYYCTLKNYDNILGLNDNIYSYYAVEELKNDNRLKEIKYMFIPSNSHKLSNDDIEFLKNVEVDRIRAYIGWLLKTRSIVQTCYDDLSNDTCLEALQNYYGEEMTMNDNILKITKVNHKKKTGILSNLLIKELSNIDLYRMDKKMKELNKGILLNSIRTDSLGYYYDKKIKLPIEMFGDDWGLWKIEDKKQKVLGNYESIKPCIIPEANTTKINNFNENDINKLLEDNKSFLICGDYGTGKTYSIEHTIKPKLNELNKKCIVTSITKSNSKRINGVTLASLLNGKSDYELIEQFSKYDYLIIDEAQQMTQDNLICFDILKSYGIKLKYIFIGDYQQSKNDAVKINWDESTFIIKLCEYNKVTMINNHRCDNKIIELVEEVKKQPIIKTSRYVFDNFQSSSDVKICNYHLYKLKATENKLKNNDFTIQTITQNQGSTINENYMIHDIKFLPKDQLITALTRATKWEQIYIYS
jgi:hypothetical protein